MAISILNIKMDPRSNEMLNGGEVLGLTLNKLSDAKMIFTVARIRLRLSKIMIIVSLSVERVLHK